jgi:acyl-CoA synthetase (AMP-forming)/AMP-acid ligase II
MPWLAGRHGTVALAELAAASSLAVDPGHLAGRGILLTARDQLAAALALIELDGIARRIVLCTPDVAPEHLPGIAADAGTEVVLTDTGEAGTLGCGIALHPASVDRTPRYRTEWVLLTSGTTGRPKLVLHTLATLTGAIRPAPPSAPPAVWSTFYDIRRYGGLQILLRALLGGQGMVLSAAGESPEDFLARVRAWDVTHISGTPSHWRRALMSAAAGSIAPRYVRLSGEIADQAILDRLKARYPAAGVSHAFASTEAGVAFEVTDGRAGFPADLIGRPGAEVEMRIEDGSLRIRSARTALRYLGEGQPPLADAEGFVDTQDLVEAAGDRLLFVGRRNGVINVGGLKVFPEEVEAVLNRDPRVEMALVRARPSPVTGALVEAEVVLRPDAAAESPEALRAGMLAACRAALAAHKVPAVLRFASGLDIGGAGKLARSAPRRP